MTRQTKLITPVNRLAQCVDAEDGVSFDELVSSAEQRVADMGDALSVYVSEQTEEILLALKQPAEAVFQHRLSIADSARCLVEVAGCVGLHLLGEVAKGIVLLIEGQDLRNTWNLDALLVHGTTLAMVSRAPSTPGLKRIIAELATLRATVGVVDA